MASHGYRCEPLAVRRLLSLQPVRRVVNDYEEVPDVLLDPPDEYPLIGNEIGVCGTKPNLYWGGTVHRIWVLHAVDGVATRGGVTEYVDAFVPPDAAAERQEAAAAVRQALAFYEEYEDVFERERARRERKVERLREDGDGGPQA